MTLLIDSDIIIHHLRGSAQATDFIDAAIQSETAYYSVVTQVEIEGGMRSHERTAVRQTFAQMKDAPVTREIAGLAGEFMRQYRRSHHTISVLDYMIAATAFVFGHELATLNVKHFPMMEGLKAPW